MPFSDVVLVILIIAVAYVALRIVDARTNQWVARETQQSSQQVEARLWSLLLAEMERRLRPLWNELDDIQHRLDNLMDEIEQKRAVTTATNASTILLICGNEAFCQTDRHALRRTNMDYQRLPSATKEEISDELQRARENHDPYRLIHISAHASPEGILLGNELVAPGWWNDHLDGVHLLVLAVCQGAAIADQLAGLVDVVVSVREGIDNQLAGEFTYVFWSSVQEGSDPREAYRQARKSLPAVAEYVSIRADMRGGKARAN